MSQCSCHCEVTNLACDTCCLYVKIFLLILCLEIDINIIKREVVCSSFLLIIISVFIFSFFFQFLDSPSQKFTLSNFHKVTFKQYFYSTRSLCFCAIIVCLFVCMSVFGV